MESHVKEVSGVGIIQHLFVGQGNMISFGGGGGVGGGGGGDCQRCSVVCFDKPSLQTVEIHVMVHFLLLQFVLLLKGF